MACELQEETRLVDVECPAVDLALRVLEQSLAAVDMLRQPNG